MLTVVRRWGNSLAVRIPKQVARSQGIIEGTELEVIGSDDDGFHLRPTGPTLAQMVAQITPENRHDEISTGPAAGSEVF